MAKESTAAAEPKKTLCLALFTHTRQGVFCNLINEHLHCA